jgi:CRP-like cAMP-binding protein
MQVTRIDEGGFKARLERAINGLNAVVSAVQISLADSQRYYRELSATRLTPAELAERTGTNERTASKWLARQAARGYIVYDPQTEQYFLSDQQYAWLVKRFLGPLS